MKWRKIGCGVVSGAIVSGLITIIVTPEDKLTAGLLLMDEHPHTHYSTYPVPEYGASTLVVSGTASNVSSNMIF